MVLSVATCSVGLGFMDGVPGMGVKTEVALGGGTKPDAVSDSSCCSDPIRSNSRARSSVTENKSNIGLFLSGFQHFPLNAGVKLFTQADLIGHAGDDNPIHVSQHQIDHQVSIIVQELFPKRWHC
jgi:hypothetical protein